MRWFFMNTSPSFLLLTLIHTIFFDCFFSFYKTLILYKTIKRNATTIFTHIITTLLANGTQKSSFMVIWTRSLYPPYFMFIRTTATTCRFHTDCIVFRQSLFRIRPHDSKQCDYQCDT